ncbi:uncharacterized protein KZ484_011762 [Pholidichthys leucotaenia]
MVVCSKHFYKGMQSFQLPLLTGLTAYADGQDYDKKNQQGMQVILPAQTSKISGHVTEMDNVAPSDDTTPLAEMEETTSDEAALICQADDAPEDNAQERQNYSKCHCRLKEFLLFQEENRKLKGELSRNTLDDNFLKDNHSKATMSSSSSGYLQVHHTSAVFCACLLGLCVGPGFNAVRRRLLAFWVRIWCDAYNNTTFCGPHTKITERSKHLHKVALF